MSDWVLDVLTMFGGLALIAIIVMLICVLLTLLFALLMMAAVYAIQWYESRLRNDPGPHPQGRRPKARGGA